MIVRESLFRIIGKTCLDFWKQVFGLGHADGRVIDEIGVCNRYPATIDAPKALSRDKIAFLTSPNPLDSFAEIVACACCLSFMMTTCLVS